MQGGECHKEDSEEDKGQITQKFMVSGRVCILCSMQQKSIKCFKQENDNLDQALKNSLCQLCENGLQGTRTEVEKLVS